jgi:hypothetical protein
VSVSIHDTETDKEFDPTKRRRRVRCCFSMGVDSIIGVQELFARSSKCWREFGVVEQLHLH